MQIKNLTFLILKKNINMLAQIVKVYTWVTSSYPSAYSIPCEAEIFFSQQNTVWIEWFTKMSVRQWCSGFTQNDEVSGGHKSRWLRNFPCTRDFWKVFLFSLSVETQKLLKKRMFTMKPTYIVFQAACCWHHSGWAAIAGLEQVLWAGL